MHWPAQARAKAYCIEWQAQDQDRNLTNCTLTPSQDQDPTGMGTVMSVALLLLLLLPPPLGSWLAPAIGACEVSEAQRGLATCPGSHRGGDGLRLGPCHPCMSEASCQDPEVSGP